MESKQLKKRIFSEDISATSVSWYENTNVQSALTDFAIKRVKADRLYPSDKQIFDIA